MDKPRPCAACLTGVADPDHVDLCDRCMAEYEADLALIKEYEDREWGRLSLLDPLEHASEWISPRSAPSDPPGGKVMS